MQWWRFQFGEITNPYANFIVHARTYTDTDIHAHTGTKYPCDPNTNPHS